MTSDRPPHFDTLDDLVAALDKLGFAPPPNRAVVATVAIQGDVWNVPADGDPLRYAELAEHLAHGGQLARRPTESGEAAGDGRIARLYLYRTEPHRPPAGALRRPVCPTCWTTLPLSGVCGTCS